MGMYDNVTCEYPLPDCPKEVQEEVWQTKDMVNLLDDFTITKDGKLIHHQCEWDIVEEKDRPYYGKPEWDDNPLFQIFGSMERRATENVIVEYHGMMHIIAQSPVGIREFYEYELKFTDGIVVDAKLLLKECIDDGDSSEDL